VPKHWAEDYFDGPSLSPQEGDEELFLTVQLMGVDKLLKLYPDEPFRGDEMGLRHAIEKFSDANHKAGPRATTGVWVRYEIWIDKQRALTAARN
jgi:hypothetical protein